MSGDINLYERNPNAKKPRKAYNTTMTRGGARDHLYPQANGWEGMDAAIARQRAQVDPRELIETSIDTLRGRLHTLLHTDAVVDPKKTRHKIATVRGLIEKYSGDKTGFLASLASLEENFTTRR